VDEGSGEGRFGLALGVTEDGVPFGLARCSGPAQDLEGLERELRQVIRATDAVLSWGDALIVVFGGDRGVAEGAANRLRGLGWRVDLLEQPFTGDLAAAAGEVISGHVAVGRRVDHPTDSPEVLVLLVEDDPDMRHFLRHTFERQGWRVLSVSNAEAAARSWHERRPDVLVADYFLPDGDGVAVCRRAREEGIEAPALICSGSLTEEIRRAADALGLPAMPKLHTDEIVAEITRLLSERPS